ncbi:MAG TPA: PAS domain-containing protein [Rhizomicrobium sp.]|nr:PAS domain-containing protein [Rhizomicrobium sp.]
MSHDRKSVPPAVYIDAPRHPDLKALFDYWSSKRGTLLIPLRSDIKPAELKPLLADIMIWNATAPFHIRLIGDHIVNFVGKNNTGRSATDGMTPDAAAAMLEVLNQVVTSKAPRFRRGKAHWAPSNAYRDFEACFLPLSDDGENVDTILSGIKFDVGQ